MADNQPQSASTQIIHRHMQRRFDLHREKLEKHKEKGPAFRAAVEELERTLFGSSGWLFRCGGGRENLQLGMGPEPPLHP